MRSLRHTLHDATTSMPQSWTFVGWAVADAKALLPRALVVRIVVLRIVVLRIMVPPRSGLHLPRSSASALSISRASGKTTRPPAESYEKDSQRCRALTPRKWRQRPQCR